MNVLKKVEDLTSVDKNAMVLLLGRMFDQVQEFRSEDMKQCFTLSTAIMRLLKIDENAFYWDYLRMTDSQKFASTFLSFKQMHLKSKPNDKLSETETRNILKLMLRNSTFTANPKRHTEAIEFLLSDFFGDAQEQVKSQIICSWSKCDHKKILPNSEGAALRRMFSECATKFYDARLPVMGHLVEQLIEWKPSCIIPTCPFCLAGTIPESLKALNKRPDQISDDEVIEIEKINENFYTQTYFAPPNKQ
ncbi:hypothetical protein Ciccas_007612 [Cichlidogyrus casuarinus]|uniref:Uncharacterized protein n=1 Tax=Cichlidogyrus casuarinus TaxID=1844966 RepID=A0ABD2Q3T6_9PLAT